MLLLVVMGLLFFVVDVTVVGVDIVVKVADVVVVVVDVDTGMFGVDAICVIRDGAVGVVVACACVVFCRWLCWCCCLW